MPSRMPVAARNTVSRVAERGAGESARQHADKGDADLHRRQELAGIGAKRQSAAGALDVAIDHRLEASRPGRDDGELGHRQKAVHADEDDHDGDFNVKHGRSLASRAQARKPASNLRLRSRLQPLQQHPDHGIAVTLARAAGHLCSSADCLLRSVSWLEEGGIRARNPWRTANYRFHPRCSEPLELT